MIIANPIYDVVFKYLLEDIDIARELLSVILGEEIVALEVKPQEHSYEATENRIRIMRFDFKATIKNATGELKNVLMELQKAKPSFDIERFRIYLAQNYAATETVTTADGKIEKWVLPIISIYFLGFGLDKVNNAAIKINREYRDMITGEVILQKEDFAEFLTHDCYIIQLTKLEKEKRNTLERVLQVFNQDYKLENEHFMKFEDDSSESLVTKMANRLERAAGSFELRDQMNFEDEFNRIMKRNIDEKNKTIELLEKSLQAERTRVEAANKNADAANKSAEAERKKNEVLQKQIEELKKGNFK